MLFGARNLTWEGYSLLLWRPPIIPTHCAHLWLWGPTKLRNKTKQRRRRTTPLPTKNVQSDNYNNKCNWPPVRQHRIGPGRVLCSTTNPSLDEFSIIKLAWLMCTKRPDNYTLPTILERQQRSRWPLILPLSYVFTSFFNECTVVYMW